ncbi:hypothetical protein [Rhodococcus sp. 06-235-1A]|uniref:hypothetical protein n=1 Tax=Rhodococcus sp. 06-235-1A TaxID=2022508 RepID=UPI00117AAC9F|nr:hypothetical protein [Rhodococcus sp. 06-235-1A]
MMPTDAPSAQTMAETSPVEPSAVDTSLLETQWGGRVVASAFVVLATGLSWVFAATAMIG